jgi:hypothetical protein
VDAHHFRRLDAAIDVMAIRPVSPAVFRMILLQALERVPICPGR